MTLQASTIYRSGGATVEMIQEPQPQPTTLLPETLIRIEARYSSVILTPAEAADVAEAIKVLLTESVPPLVGLVGHRFCYCEQPESAHYGAKL